MRRKKTILDKLIAGLLAVSMILSGGVPFDSTVAEAADKTPAITNADMSSHTVTTWETGYQYVKNWTHGGSASGASKHSQAPYDSGKAKLVKNQAGTAYLASADISGLAAGKLYQLSIEVQTENTEEQNVQLIVRYLTGEAYVDESIACFYNNDANSETKLINGYFRNKCGDGAYDSARLLVALTDKEDGVYTKEATLWADNAAISLVEDTAINQVETSFEGDVSSMQIGYQEGYGYAESKPGLETDATHYHAGSKSLHITKDSYNSQTYINNLGRFQLYDDSITTTAEMQYTWGAYVKSKDSNNFLRIDLDVYDTDGKYLSTLTGNKKMLSRSKKLDSWERLTTTENLPDGAFYGAYRIVLSEGKTDVYLDDVFGKLTETYYYKLSDWDNFEGLDEEGCLDGWSSDATLTVQNHRLSWSGTMAIRRIETLIPGATYRLAAGITASTEGTLRVRFYDVNRKSIGGWEKTIGASETSLSEEITVPQDAMLTKISYGGIGNYTITSWNIEEISANTTDSQWVANWVWYPEKLNTENANRYFRSHFHIEDRSKVSAAYLQMAYDDAMELHVNASDNITDQLAQNDSKGIYSPSPYSEVGKRDVRVYDITDKLVTGDNLIAIKVWNDTSYGGVVYELTVSYTDGTKETLASGVNLEVKTSKESTDYTKTELDESGWKTARNAGVPAYSLLGDVAWWSGPAELTGSRTDVLTFNTGAAKDGYLNYAQNQTVKAGDRATLSGIVASVSAGEREAFHNSTVTGWLYQQDDGRSYATVPVKLEITETNHATVSFTVPDYLPAGTYALRLDKTKVVWCWNGNNQFGIWNVTMAEKTKKNATVTAKDNGTVGLYIDGEETTPVMYLRPHMQSLYNYHDMKNFAASGTTIYATYNGFLNGMDYRYQKTDENNQCIWRAWDEETKTPTMDYTNFDYEIYRTLDLNQTANVLVNICVDAPQWWMDANPDELIKNQDGKAVEDTYSGQNCVSMSSTKYQEQLQVVLKAMVAHMKEAGYAHRIVGIKLIAGRTYEWMNTGVESGQLIDYSDAALSGFRNYMNDKNVTIPTLAERTNAGATALLDPSVNQTVIDYNNYLGEASADYLLACTSALKEAMGEDTQWIVGAYNGYIWNFDSSEAIGSAHTSISKVLADPSVDFIASPLNYSERIDGYSVGNMALSDSVAAAGKLYMIEQDNRTYLSGKSGDSLGATYTVSDSVSQVTRDMATDFVRGEGLWFYDMEGGWYNDDSLTARIHELKTEWEKHLDLGSNNEIALYVPEKNYNYLTADIGNSDTSLSSYLMQALYQNQRRELAAMGASYDTWMVEDVLNDNYTSKWSQYKLHIVLSPFELSSEDAAKLKERLGQNQAYVLWVYLPGVSNGGAFSGSNVTELVGMDVSYHNTKKALQAKTTDGVTYGNKNAKTGPWAYINDADATILATYTSGQTAVAKKTMNGYTSVYSAVPDVPAEMLRTLCREAGVHLYSDDMSDVIETNNSYVMIHSVAGGDKTITLQDSSKYVYDVLSGDYLKVKKNQVTFYMEAGATRLLRLETEQTENANLGTMTYTDVTEDPDAYVKNLFYNGTFDKKDGTADVSGWSVGVASSKESVTYGDNLIKYPIEAGEEGVVSTIAGWAMNNKATGDDVTVISENGIKAFKYDRVSDGNNRYFNCYGDITLEAGAEYELSIDVKGDFKTLQINQYGRKSGDDTSISYVSWKTYTDVGSEWSTKTVTFTAVEGAKCPYFQFVWADTNKAGSIYMKNYQIRKVAKNTTEVKQYDDSLIKYPIEAGEEGVVSTIAGWAMNNKATGDDVTVISENGVKAFKYDRVSDGNNRYFNCYGDITLEAGAEYELSIDVKGDFKTLQINQYGRKSGDDTSISYVSWKTYTDVGSEWSTKTVTFTAVEGAKCPYFQFVWADTNKAGSIYMKNYQIRKVTTTSKQLYDWTEGVGGHSEEDNCLMVNSKGEFWNYGTKVEEGKQYTYSMDVKVVDAEAGFNFYPYVYNFSDGGWQAFTQMQLTADTDGYQRVSGTFTAKKPDGANGTRFGFVRTGTGTVYIDNITLVESAKEDLVPADNMVVHGDTMQDWEGLTPISCFTGKGGKGVSASATMKMATTKYATYIVKFRADVTNTTGVTVTLGGHEVQSVDLTDATGWKEFSCEIGAKEGSDSFSLTTIDNKEISWDAVRVYRKYEMGDATGDGRLDSRDLVRMKWNTQAGIDPARPLATYVFVDFTNKTGASVTDDDMKQLRKWLADYE